MEKQIIGRGLLAGALAGVLAFVFARIFSAMSFARVINDRPNCFDPSLSIGFAHSAQMHSPHSSASSIKTPSASGKASNISM